MPLKIPLTAVDGYLNKDTCKNGDYYHNNDTLVT